MNNKACKDSAEGERRHVLRPSVDLLTGYDSGICITSRGVFPQPGRMLGGPVAPVLPFLPPFSFPPYRPVICYIDLVPLALSFFGRFAFPATGAVVLGYVRVLT